MVTGFAAACGLDARLAAVCGRTRARSRWA